MTQPAAAIPVIQGNLGQILGYLSQSLKTFPRRVPGRLVIDGRELRYVDLHSFYWQVLQIFHSRLYDIRTHETAPLIVDCGAHIGLASLFFATRFPQATIHAFEADPAIAEVMAANLHAHGARHVITHAQAVWVHGDGTLGRFLSVLERNGFRTVVHDLHLADWLGTDNPPPFAALSTRQYIITVFAWREGV